MLDREILVRLAGTPRTKGSMKCVGRRGKVAHVVVEDNKASTPYRERLAHAARQATQRGEKGQPIGVEVTSTIPRPAAHYGTGRNADQLKASAPAYPIGHNTGDVDKLARLVLDALQDSGILPDDCQVVELVTRKGYPQPDLIGRVPDAMPYPGTLLRVYPLP